MQLRDLSSKEFERYCNIQEFMPLFGGIWLMDISGETFNIFNGKFIRGKFHRRKTVAACCQLRSTKKWQIKPITSWRAPRIKNSKRSNPIKKCQLSLFD